MLCGRLAIALTAGLLLGLPSVYGQGSGPLFSTPMDVAVEADGDLVVADCNRGLCQSVAVVRIDGDTEVCSIVSDPGTGSGPDFFPARGIAVEASGDLVLVDGNCVFRVDPVTGDRTLVSGSGMGTGPNFVAINGIVVEASGDLVVSDPFLGALIRVDPVTGDRTTLSDSGTGSGPLLGPSRIALEASGDIVVAGTTAGAQDAVLRVDPVTGDRTLVSGAGTGAGPAFEGPDGIAVEASGDLVVTDFFLRGVFRVDPVTGDRTLLSGAGAGAGPAFANPVGMAVEASGDLVVADFQGGVGTVFRVNPVTGDRVVIECVDPMESPFVRGDCNSDVSLDISDAIKLLGALFLGDGITCEDACDANDDGALDISDATTVLNFLFLGGSLPPPGPACGPDSGTPDGLACDDGGC